MLLNLDIYLQHHKSREMSDTETEQQEIQVRVQQIFAHNTLPLSDTSEVSDLDLSLTHPANPNTCFDSFPPQGYPTSSGDSSYSEPYQFGGEDQLEVPRKGTERVLTPREVGSRINSAAHKYRVCPSNTIQSLESGHVARRVEMFQDAQNASRGGCSNSSRVDSPIESNVSQLKAKFDLAPSTSPLPRKFSHPASAVPRIGEWREDRAPVPAPRATPESLYSAEMSTHNSSFQKFNYVHASPSHPRSILRRSQSASPERSGYTPRQDSRDYSHFTQAYPNAVSRSRSVSPKLRATLPAPQSAPRGRDEDLYARPDISHKRKRTLSCSSPSRSPPKRPSLSCNPEGTSLHTSLPSSAVFNTSTTSRHSTGASPSQPRSRRISMSPQLEISKQLMRTVRRSMSPEDLRQLEAQYGAPESEEAPKGTNSVMPSTSPKPVPANPAPYSRNRSFISAVAPGCRPGSRPVPTPASPLDTSLGFPRRIPRRSATSFSLHTAKSSEEEHTLTMDDSRPVTKSLSSNLTICNSQSSLDTLSTDISSISSTVPTHCLTFSSGYNIHPAPVPSAPPQTENQIVTRSAARSSSSLKERLGALRNQIFLLEDGWRQATSALIICHAHGGMSGSDEEVEAERLLLNCSLRREAFFHEVKLLESGYGTEPLASCTATLTLSGIQLSLNQQFMEHLTTRTGIKFSYHFVCVIKSSHPSQVVATHPLSPHPSVLNPNYNQLAFPDTLVLHCVKEGFQLTPMVYLFEASKREDAIASQSKTPVSKVKSILKAAKSGSPLKRQKSLKKAKRKLPLVTSETEIVLKKTRFALIASTNVDKRHINRSDFRLEPHPSPVTPYPLIPLLRFTVSASPDLERQEVRKGFLTIFHDDLTWNRRWCVLAYTTLSYWLYPEEEEQARPPAGTIELQFITGGIESTNRIQCARMNTFCFHCGRTRSKKYLISADSKQEKEEWMKAIKQIQTNIQAWA